MKKPPVKADPKADAGHKSPDLRLDPKEVKTLAKLFGEGHDAAQKDPQKYWEQKRMAEDATPPFHGFHQLVGLPSKAQPPQAPSQPMQKSLSEDDERRAHLREQAARLGLGDSFSVGGQFEGWRLDDIEEFLSREEEASDD